MKVFEDDKMVSHELKLFGNLTITFMNHSDFEDTEYLVRVNEKPALSVYRKEVNLYYKNFPQSMTTMMLRLADKLVRGDISGIVLMVRDLEQYQLFLK